MPKYKFAVSAFGLLNAEDKVSLCPATTKKTYDAAFDTKVEQIREKPSSDWTSDDRAYIQKVVFDDREDAALSLAVAQGDKAIAIQYGAGHTFLGALERWNGAHPDLPLGIVSVGNQKDKEAEHK